MRKTEIKLHGILGQQIGRSLWNLVVHSVGDAIRAIEVLSGHKLYKQLIDNDKEGIKYRILINGRDFKSPKPLSIDDLDSLKHSELAVNIRNLRTIDIIPVIQGAGDNIGGILQVIIGVLIIVAGILVSIGTLGGGIPLGVGMIIIGASLVTAGIISLLSSPPKFEDFREIQNSGRKASYLFNGPENVEKEGGPVPVGYGRLIVGSQVISTSYDVTDEQIDDQGYISS